MGRLARRFTPWGRRPQSAARRIPWQRSGGRSPSYCIWLFARNARNPRAITGIGPLAGDDRLTIAVRRAGTPGRDATTRVPTLMRFEPPPGTVGEHAEPDAPAARRADSFHRTLSGRPGSRSLAPFGRCGFEMLDRGLERGSPLLGNHQSGRACRRASTPVPFGAAWGQREKRLLLRGPLILSTGWGRCSHQCRCSGCRSRRTGCSSSLRRAGRRHDGVRGACWPVGSIRASDQPRVGVGTRTTRTGQLSGDGASCRPGP
jgi:hypothetical protein